MTKQSLLNQYLHLLDDLIVRERTAIIYSKMEMLESIQQEKSTLLILLQHVDLSVDEETIDLAVKIRENNKRNELLLQSGLKLICGLRKNINRRRSSTYSSGGRSEIPGFSPRILKRSI